MDFATLDTLETDLRHAVGDLVGDWIHESVAACRSISGDIPVHML